MKKTYFAVLITALVLTACSKTPADSVSTSISSTTPTTSVNPTSISPETVSQTEPSIPAETVSEPSGFLFTPSGNITLYIHQEASAVLEALGEPLSFLEAPSCAFQGMDRIYGFGGFELTTYEKNGKEYFYDIYFLDDSVTTEEGIYIGCTKEEMEAAYGMDYIEESGAYTYQKDGMTLQFLFENNHIVSIRYNGTEQ